MVNKKICSAKHNTLEPAPDLVMGQSRNKLWNVMVLEENLTILWNGQTHRHTTWRCPVISPPVTCPRSNAHPVTCPPRGPPVSCPFTDVGRTGSGPRFVGL